ncbi:MAG: tRNA dimethylallyltransferase [Pseudomonadota bacterium]|jgi:tRNA dimethylallyltransferase
MCPLAALAIAGPTASGKTALSLALAEHFAARGLPVEIISVDSALVYRGMDIGTAKPAAAELAAVPHHLIDLIDPADSYSAAEFVRDAEAAMGDIRSRGRLPLLVGGTMLYFKALFEGLDDLPVADAAIRADIEAQALAHGWPAMHAKLALVDAATAQRLPPTDSQRIGRALEVFAATGKPLSAHFTAKEARTDIALISLEPQNRVWLHERIAQRFQAMLDAGFEDEVRALMARGDLSPELPSMRCVGYRQMWQTLAGEEPRQTMAERGIAATRQLAKRQLTWLRSFAQRHVVACDGQEAKDQLIRLADQLVLQLDKPDSQA